MHLYGDFGLSTSVISSLLCSLSFISSHLENLKNTASQKEWTLLLEFELCNCLWTRQVPSGRKQTNKKSQYQPYDFIFYGLDPFQFLVFFLHSTTIKQFFPQFIIFIYGKISTMQAISITRTRTPKNFLLTVYFNNSVQYVFSLYLSQYCNQVSLFLWVLSLFRCSVQLNLSYLKWHCTPN